MVQQRLSSFDGEYPFVRTFVNEKDLRSFYRFIRIIVAGGRSGRRFILTLATGMVFGFLSACLLITSTRDVPHMFSWIPGNSGLSRDPHHYSELESEVAICAILCSTFKKISGYSRKKNRPDDRRIFFGSDRSVLRQR